MYTQFDTVVALSENIITIDDEYGTCAPYIAEIFADSAVENGYDIYKCYCPLSPMKKTEHIIIPELKLTLFTQNSYHSSLTGDERQVCTSRFYEKALFSQHKEKLTFLSNAKSELIDEAVKNLGKALKVHDELEKFYIQAVDFGKIDEMGERILF